MNQRQDHFLINSIDTAKNLNQEPKVIYSILEFADMCIVLGWLEYAVVAGFKYIYVIISVGMAGKQTQYQFKSKPYYLTSNELKYRNDLQVENYWARFLNITA